MNIPVLERLKAEGRNTYLRVLKWVNNSLAGLFAAVSAAYATYPDSVKAFIKHLPEWLVFPAAIAVFWFIRSVINRANSRDKATVAALSDAVQNAGQGPS